MYIKKSLKSSPDYALPNRDANVLLDGNELSFPVGEMILRDAMEMMKSIPIQRYPAPEIIRDLETSIATYLNLEADNIILGVGTSGLLGIICSVIGEPGSNILIPDPSFSVYSHYILASDKKVCKLPLNESFDIDVSLLKMTIQRENPGLIILPYPNNPTGNLFCEEAFLFLLNHFTGVLCIDEVYYDYAKKSFIHLINDHDNLVVLRSLSKIGFAGGRLGILTASKTMAKEIRKGVLPYTINILSAVAAKAYLKNIDQIMKLVDVIINERDRLINELKLLADVRVYKSQANFILCDFGDRAQDLKQYLYNECSISVRELQIGTRLETCLRITVGSPEENDALLRAIKSFSGVGP